MNDRQPASTSACAEVVAPPEVSLKRDDCYGMDAQTGHMLDRTAHIQQSISNILRTPKGSLVGRRDYGSQVHRFVDRGLDAPTRMQLFAEVARALSAWEPRYRLQQVDVLPVRDKAGFHLRLTGQMQHQTQSTAIEVTL